MNAQQFRIFEQRGLRISWKSQAYLEMLKRIYYNSPGGSILGERLLQFNDRGIHLDDFVFQKLQRSYNTQCNLLMRPDTSYIRGALARLGNRTMTEEEYLIIHEMKEESLVGYHQPPKQLEKFNHTRSGFGPFYLNKIPRTKEDLYKEAEQ